MSKKYKLKRKRKNLISYYVIIIIIVFSIFSATGYALFSDNLKISGTANIKDSGGDDPELEYGNSTYTWDASVSWGEPGNYTFSVPITIKNLDKDYCYGQTNDPNDIIVVKISFINDNFIPWESMNSYSIWQAKTIEYVDGELVLTYTESNSWWTIGTESTLYLQLCFNIDDCYMDPSQLDLVGVKSVSLNGKLCTDVTNTSSSQ